MESRYIDLQQILEGYSRTGVPLVAVENGHLAAGAPADDIGIFYFIPEMVRHWGLSLDQSITVFFVGIIAFSFILGLIGCFMWLKKPLMRAFAVIAIGLVLYITMKCADVYAISSCTVVIAVPWFLYFIKQGRTNPAFFIFIAAIGLIMGAAQILRAHSGTAVLILILMVIWFSRVHSWKAKTAVTVLLFVFLAVTPAYFKILIAQRDRYLSGVIPGYVSAPTAHTFWHQVYIGMGYIPNNYGIEYDDWSAHSRALEIDPNMEYRSERYSEILKGEVIRIANEDPGFIARLVLAKLLKIIIRLLMCANIGLIAALLRPKPLNLELGFWLAIGFGALFGLLTKPWSGYILSFIAICAMYSVASVDHWWSEGEARDSAVNGK
jgi:hypothetical protein